MQISMQEINTCNEYERKKQFTKIAGSTMGPQIVATSKIHWLLLWVIWGHGMDQIIIKHEWCELQFKKYKYSLENAKTYWPKWELLHGIHYIAGTGQTH